MPELTPAQKAELARLEFLEKETKPVLTEKEQRRLVELRALKRPLTSEEQAELSQLQLFEGQKKPVLTPQQEGRLVELRALQEALTPSVAERLGAAAERAYRLGLERGFIEPAKETRFIDAGITGGVAAATVLWTASRESGPDIGWAIFWSLLGGFAAVQAERELKYAGFGVLGANAAYLGLRAFGFIRR